MKVKLLKKLRGWSRNEVHVKSITKTNGFISGISYSYKHHDYSGLAGIMSVEKIMKRVEHIYIEKYLKQRK